MKNKLTTCFGYIFIVIFSFGILYFQAGTLSMIPKETLSQNYTGDGFVNEEGDTYNPMPNTPSNEEIYALINKYLPMVGIVVIAGLVIVILSQRSKLRKIEKPGLIRIENQTAMLESDIANLIPHYDKDKFINARYNDFLEIKRAYITNDRFKLKRKLTDQLYNMYIQQIDMNHARGEVHTIRDTRYRGAVIKNIEQINTMMILTMELKVCYFEYLEKNNVLLSGNKNKKVICYYELKFITDLQNFVSKCPKCGATSHDTFKRVCEYCNHPVEETDLVWLLKQENIVIKSYGDDI